MIAVLLARAHDCDGLQMTVWLSGCLVVWLCSPVEDPEGSQTVFGQLFTGLKNIGPCMANAARHCTSL